MSRVQLRRTTSIDVDHRLPSAGSEPTVTSYGLRQSRADGLRPSVSEHGPVPDPSSNTLADEIGRRLMSAGMTAAAAESLTGGSISCALAAAPDASTWFRGAITAYAPDVKFAVLGVEPGPVITASCATQMASGAARLLGADACVATTGVGGPGPEEGHPAGTVFIAVHCRSVTTVAAHRFYGDPALVVERATEAALRLLLDAIE